MSGRSSRSDGIKVVRRQSTEDLLRNPAHRKMAPRPPPGTPKRPQALKPISGGPKPPGVSPTASSRHAARNQSYSSDAQEFTDEEIEKCEAIFKKFEKAGKGYLERDEFLLFQRTLRTETSVEEAYTEFAKWCGKGKTKLTMPELVMNLQTKLKVVPIEKRALVLDILLSAAPEDLTHKVGARRASKRIPSDSRTSPSSPKIEDISDDTRLQRMHDQAHLHKQKHGNKGFMAPGPDQNAHFQVKAVPKPSDVTEMIVEALGRNVAFALMEPGKIREVASVMFQYEVPAGVNIIEQETIGDNFYVLGRGKVEIGAEDGTITEALPGASFGELALLYGCPRAATVCTIEPCTLWAIDRLTFQSVVVSAVNSVHEWTVKFLREKVTILSNLEKHQLSTIASLLVPVDFADGQQIIEEGQEGTAFYIIKEGNVLVSRRGIPSSLAVLAPGDYFGETALMSEVSRTSSVHARGMVQCLALDRAAFNECFGSLKALLQRQQVRRVLCEIKAYKDMNEAVMQRLLDAFECLNFEPGEVVVNEQQPWPYFCIILEGVVQVCNNARGLRGEMGAAKWFGDFKTPKAMATIKCKTATTLARLSYKGHQHATMKHIKRGQSSQAVMIGRMQQIAWKDLTMYNTLGVGTFSKVRLTKYVMPNPTKEVHWFAMKCVDKRTVVMHGAEQQIMNELKLIQQLTHPFIIGLSATFKDANKLYLLTELVQGGEFFNYIAGRGVLREDETRFYTANVLLGLEHMHNNNIVYRDLKPENIVMATSGYLKMVDLGFAKKMDAGQTYTVCGTPDYIAPEIVASKGHNKAVDYWSLGVLVYEMITGLTPYYDPNGNVFQIYEKILNERLQFPAGIAMSPEVKALISSLLFVNPSRRLGAFKGGANDVKEHAWFNSFDFSAVEARVMPSFHKPQIKSPEEMMKSYEEEPDEVFRDTCNWDPDFDMSFE